MHLVKYLAIVAILGICGDAHAERRDMAPETAAPMVVAMRDQPCAVCAVASSDTQARRARAEVAADGTIGGQATLGANVALVLLGLTWLALSGRRLRRRGAGRPPAADGR